MQTYFRHVHTLVRSVSIAELSAQMSADVGRAAAAFRRSFRGHPTAPGFVSNSRDCFKHPQPMNPIGTRKRKVGLQTDDLGYSKSLRDSSTENTRFRRPSRWAMARFAKFLSSSNKTGSAQINYSAC